MARSSHSTLQASGQAAGEHNSSATGPCVPNCGTTGLQVMVPCTRSRAQAHACKHSMLPLARLVCSTLLPRRVLPRLLQPRLLLPKRMPISSTRPHAMQDLTRCWVRYSRSNYCHAYWHDEQAAQQACVQHAAATRGCYCQGLLLGKAVTAAATTASLRYKGSRGRQGCSTLLQHNYCQGCYCMQVALQHPPPPYPLPCLHSPPRGRCQLTHAPSYRREAQGPKPPTT